MKREKEKLGKGKENCEVSKAGRSFKKNATSHWLVIASIWRTEKKKDMGLKKERASPG